MSTKPGIYKDMSNEDYHADSAIGSSGIISFMECPAIYWHRYVDKAIEFKKTASMTFGSHAHVVLLEPDLFGEQYIVAEDSIDKKTIKAWKEFEREAKEAGKTPLLYKEMERLAWMSTMIKRKNSASSMLGGKGITECSFFAEDPETGLMLKARPDRLVKTEELGWVIVDYKTTGFDLGDDTQSKHALGLNRHIQAFHHKRVVELATQEKISHVCYVVQMSEPPFLVRTFRMPDECLEVAEQELSAAINGIVECTESGVFPDFPDSISDYQPPSWWYYKYN